MLEPDDVVFELREKWTDGCAIESPLHQPWNYAASVRYFSINLI
jgi:hypothetical protein